MSMTTKKARFALYSPELIDSIKKKSLSYVELTPEAEEKMKAALSDWYIKNDCHYSYENDDYGYTTSSVSTNNVPVTQMTSLSSGSYCTSDVRGDILIENGEFIGVVIYIENSGGNGWSNYHEPSCSIFYTDGRIDGKAVSRDGFSGESSSRDTTNYYALCKKE